MNIELTHTKYFVLASMLLAFFSVMPPTEAITSSPPTEASIKILLDKDAYNRGEVITVSGSVKSFVFNTPLTITIIAPDGNLVYIAQVLVSTDGTFTLPIKVEGPLWRIPGTYTISTQYGFKHISTQTTFEFEEQNNPITEVFHVTDHSSGQNFNLDYIIIGGTVKDMSIEPTDLSLIVKIDSKTNGVITLKIPRLLMDAKTETQQDEPFIVLIDDDEIISNVEEPSDLDNRVLKIPFSEGDYKIDIIGTTIVPEFSEIVSLVFVTALATSLIFMMFVNLKFSNKKLLIMSNI